jgi:SAM-dependent methyltransferase
MRSLELFLVSALILFLELACIRWFPAHVLFLTFFTNIVLLASFLGMSLGCLAANHRRTYLVSTPIVLALTLVAAFMVEEYRHRLGVDVGNQASPQVIFFGTEYAATDVALFVIPIEVIGAFFFVAIALAFVGPGQVLGRALRAVPDRIRAYTLNIAGSLAGIALFALCSWLQLSPLWWFGFATLLMSYWLFDQARLRAVSQVAAIVVILIMAWHTAGEYVPRASKVAEHFWSPYYRIDYMHSGRQARSITVNLIGHQSMNSRTSPVPAYALPHLLNRDAGGRPFENVLIIGAGSGNDVSRALQWGATHVDAVEIDPVINRLGRQDHPDRPFSDPRVRVVLDDGRNVLRASEGKKYDLVIYALVDSLVLHSSYSNIRLESYLFTRQAFEDVHRVLKPGGTFVMYNYFRQGWLVSRLDAGLQDVFGAGNPLVMTLPLMRRIEPEVATPDVFTVFFAGNTAPLRQAFATQPEYWLPSDAGPSPSSPNGFTTPDSSERARLTATAAAPADKDPADKNPAGWQRFALATLVPPAEPLRMATDDWPFLYLRQPMIPALNIRSMLMMATLAVLMIVICLKLTPSENDKRARSGTWFDASMFFLGAGFMLIETKAVVHMALLFGSTWMVNSIVFFAVLLMILGANLFVLRVSPAKLWPYYTGLIAALAINGLVPLDWFLNLSRTPQVIGASAMVFAPILFAAVIFAVTFSRTASPDRAFGFNIAGAMLGGLAENLSMLLGFQHLMLVAILFYVLSAMPRRIHQRPAPAALPVEPLGLDTSRTTSATARSDTRRAMSACDTMPQQAP